MTAGAASTASPVSHRGSAAARQRHPVEKKGGAAGVWGDAEAAAAADVELVEQKEERCWILKDRCVALKGICWYEMAKKMCF